MDTQTVQPVATATDDTQLWREMEAERQARQPVAAGPATQPTPIYQTGTKLVRRISCGNCYGTGITSRQVTGDGWFLPASRFCTECETGRAALLLQQERHCPECNNGWQSDERGAWLPCTICEVGRELDNEIDYLIKQARAERLQRILKAMPEELAGCTFDNFEADTEARKEALDFATNCAGLRANMLLIGRVGAGKSHLAAAAFFSAWERGLAGAFYTFSGLCDRLRATFANPDEPNTYEVVFDYYKNLPVLVIDDLGKVKPYDFELKVAFELFNYRAGNPKLWTIVTTNLSRSQLNDWFGEAVTSRLGKRNFTRFMFEPGRFDDYRERAW